MLDMLITCETFQGDKSWLKETAARNMYSMSSTWPTSQADISWLNPKAKLNIPRIVITWETFQGVWDVEIDPEGRLALLDLGGPAVHVYDANGAHLGSLESSGLDEGQLDGPMGIAWSAPGALMVWDQGASWISTFDAAGEEIRFVERRRAFAFGETGFCAADGRVFLSYYGFQDGNVVHEIGDEGPAHSFGAAPEVVGADELGPELQEIAIEELTPSALHCSEAGVLDVGFVQSIVRLHDVEGTELWKRTFDDFRPIVAYSDDGVGLGRAFDEGEGSHLLRSVVPWGDSIVLVQHELRRREVPLEARILCENKLILPKQK